MKNAPKNSEIMLKLKNKTTNAVKIIFQFALIKKVLDIKWRVKNESALRLWEKRKRKKVSCAG